ncbi:MAG: nitronate monooxygenase [Cardiobacteriaceae bacterium]|nr:nitronate monooxygenase [Cardiobacteriaceae bacterium]
MALLDNALTRRLNTPYPFWQAPLPFDLVPAEFAGQISAAGALGMLRVAPFDTCHALQTRIERYRTHHANPAICFYHTLPQQAQMMPVPAWESEAFFASLDIYPPPELPAPDSFENLLGTAIAAAPRAIGFAHGLPERDYISALREQGIFTFAVCTDLAEAVAAEIFGVDALVLQGPEAGGERAGFANDLASPPQPALSLLQQVRRDINLPLIVWGDFSDSADIVAAILCGAQSVMLDRPWLTCAEAALDEGQYRLLRETSEFANRATTCYSAHPLRHFRVSSAQTHSEAASREALWHHYFAQKPEARPLCAAASPTPQAADLNTLLQHYQQGIRQFLA